MTRKSLLGLWCVLLATCITAFALTSYGQTASSSSLIGNGAGPTPRITQQIDERAYVTLTGNTRPEAANAVGYRGPASATLPLDHIFLFLKRSPEQEQALDRYIQSLNDRKSPNFHKWLTPEELGSAFGVADEDIQQVTNWLESQGFQVNQVYPNKMLIDISGTAGAVQQAFRTQIGKLTVDGQAHIANMTDPQIPAALAPVIQGFASLNDFRPHANNIPATQYTFAGCASSTTRPTSPGTCYAVTPQDNAVIYNLNPLWSAGYSGQGQTIAVVEDTNTYGGAGDWNTYRSTFGLSGYAGTYTQLHPGCSDPGTNGDDGEAAIDVEVATGIAPSAAIQLLACPSGSVTFGGLIALQNTINAAGPYPGVVSVSYGVCEAANGNGGNAAFYNTYQQAAAQGISVFTSSGDEGASGCSRFFGTNYAITSLGVSGWGGTPYDVSVGGTDFEDTYFNKINSVPLSTYWNPTNDVNYGSAKQYIPEIPWNDSCASTLIAKVATNSFSVTSFCNAVPGTTTYQSSAAASGGASNCATGQGGTSQSGQLLSVPQCQGYPKPSFQTGAALTGSQAVYGVPSDGVRDVPDISMFAANGIWGHFETVCWSDPTQTSGGAASCAGAPSTWSGFGGTSVSSPTMAAVQALVNQRTGQTWGVPLAYYYQIGQSEYGTSGGSFQGTTCNASGSGGPGSGCVFNDVTQGDIDLGCQYNSTAARAHCYRPTSPNGASSTDVITAATVINGGSGYTSAPTCAIAGPSNNQAYKAPDGTTLYAGGTQATCTAAFNSGTNTAAWTVTMSSTSGVSDTIVLSNNNGTTTCGPYTLAGGSTTLMASNLAASIGTGCSLATATSAGAVTTITSRVAGYAGNFNTNFGSNGNIFQAFYVYITNTAKGQGPGFVSSITVSAGGSGYNPETPITLTGGGGSGAVAVANTSPGTAASTYQPAWGAAPGYDLATGLGTPNAYNLVNSSVWGPVQQPQTITFPNPGPVTYGVAPITLTATASSGLPVSYSIISGPGSISGSTLTVSGAGTIVVEADQAGNSNWQAAPPVQDSIVVNQAVLTVKADNASITEGSPLPTFTASYSGFVNGDGQGVLSGSPSLTTNAPQNPPVGTYTITAAQGTLSAANYSFTFVNGTLTVTAAVAQITSPPKNSTLTGSTATFTWSHETGASSYQLWLGHSAGAHDITSIGTSGLTASVTDLPTDGSPIYATLYGYANSTWTVEDTAVYTAASIVSAQITAPTKGSTLTGDTATFTWTAETGATSYQIWVGTTAGGKDIATSGTSNLTLTIAGLPMNGSQIYVTLYGYSGGIWSVQDTATYTAASPAQITSPAKGSTLTGSTATFTWTAENGATSYQLWVGTTAGGHDLAVVGTSNLTATVGGLPTNGSTIYVTLYGYAGGSWTVQDSATYTAATVANAQITSPPNGSTLPSDTVTFTWTAESGATSYQLWLGSAPGQFDLGVGGTEGLAVTISNLPTNGSQVFATLYGYSGGVWSVQDTATYLAAGGGPTGPNLRGRPGR